MASFAAYLNVGSSTYRLYSYDLSIQQETDSLGRPSSATQGGVITCTMDAPNDGFLHQWMFSPTMQADGKLVLMQESPEATLKTISFFNAYCVNLDIRFRPGAGGAGSFVNTLRISPQRVAVGAIVLDNNWPLASHGAGETFQLASYQRNGAVTTPPKPRKPPICAQVDKATTAPTKVERYAARMEVLQASREKLQAQTRQPNGLVAAADATRVARNLPAPPQLSSLETMTNRLELNNRAIERARLSDDIYIWGKEDLYKSQLNDPDPKKAAAASKALADLRKKVAVPGVHPPEGWTVEEPFYKDPKTGFAYAVYQSTFEKPARPVLVFRGTDNADAAMIDWKTNATQGMGMETAQYTQSIRKAQELTRRYNGKLEIAGHSKAGGQAAAASIVTAVKGYTFNAAGVHSTTVGRFNKTREEAKKVINGKPLVNAFNFPHDVLNYVQDIPQFRKAATVSGLLPVIGFAGGGYGGAVYGGKGSESVGRYVNPIMPNFVNKLAGNVAGGTLGAVTAGTISTVFAPIVGAKMYFNNEMPPAAGVRTVLPAQDINGKPIATPGVTQLMDRVEYHGMPYLIDSMEKQKKDDLKGIANALGCS